MKIWLPFVETRTSYKDIEEFILSLDLILNPTYAIIKNKKPIGIIGFKLTDNSNRKTELGYWLSPVHQGKGIMTECVKRLLKEAFVSKNMNRVQIKVGENNFKSRRIPEKLGFVYEGSERCGELLLTGFTDIRVYSILKKEYLDTFTINFE